MYSLPPCFPSTHSQIAPLLKGYRIDLGRYVLFILSFFYWGKDKFLKLITKKTSTKLLTFVTSKGFEPPTLGAEIRYSIQLNYEAGFINDYR